MFSRKKHPNKFIEKAVQYAEGHNWKFKQAGNCAYAWGRLLCPLHEREGCSMSVWSTPRNPEDHAKQIRRKLTAAYIFQERIRYEYESLPIHIGFKKC